MKRIVLVAAADAFITGAAFAQQAAPMPGMDMKGMDTKMMTPGANDTPSTKAVSLPPRLAGTTESVEMLCLQPQSTAIRELRPTQMTVGFREVAERRRRWRAASTTGEDAARRLIVPVVRGP